MKYYFVFLIFVSLVFAETATPTLPTAPGGGSTSLSYVDEATSAFKKLTENYNKVTEGNKNRIEGPVEKKIEPLVGEKRTSAFLIDARITEYTGTTRSSTREATKRVSNEISTLAQLSAKIQELELLITEQITMRNQLRLKENVKKRIEELERKKNREK